MRRTAGHPSPRPSPSRGEGEAFCYPSARRIWGLMYRHLALYRRSWPRLLELAYWPTLQMCIWGFTASFFASRLGNAGAMAIGLLLGAVLLWEVALRSQMGVAIGFLEEIWSRNLGHVFVSPLRPWELVAALIVISILRTAAGVIPAAVLAWALYAYNLLSLGPVLILFVVNLMAMGWWVSLGVVSLILRHGAGAEALAWSVLFGLTPFSAVFYPVSVLPAAVRPIAWALPSAHVFEGMRGVIATGAIGWDHLAWATGLNLAWLAAAALLFTSQFRAARVRGALLTIGE
jgi:ABC-2 type transport system permease protein